MEKELESVLDSLKSMEAEEGLRLGKVLNALSLISSVLGEGSWVGIYILKGDKWLLGPFEGTPACEKIRLGKGVVGSCGDKKETITVSDVTSFPGYICCDAKAKSEICVPMFIGEEVKGIFDIDLPYIHEYNKEEVAQFEAISKELIRLDALSL